MAAALIGAEPAAALSIRLPPIAGFHVGHQAAQGRQILVELVPDGETVQKFSKMITLQTVPGLGRVPTAGYVAEFAKRYIARCPGSTATVVPFGKNNAGVRIDCSRHPATAKAETVFARALQVGPDMGMVQITMTSLAMPKDAQWARDYLGKVRLQ